MNQDAPQPIISPPLSPPPAMNSTLDAPQGEQPPEVGAKQPATRPQAKVKLPKGPYRPPTGLDNTKYLKSDLKAFGFDAKEVKQLVAKKEPVVDAQGQRPPHAAGIVVRSDSHGSNNSWNDGEDGEEKWNGRAGRTTGKNGNGKGYEHLYLKEGTSKLTPSLIYSCSTIIEVANDEVLQIGFSSILYAAGHTLGRSVRRRSY